MYNVLNPLSCCIQWVRFTMGLLMSTVLVLIGLFAIYIIYSKIMRKYDLDINKQKEFTNMCIVLLTIASILIAYNAYNISQNQLMVDKINHQPDFSFQSYRDDTNHFEWFKVYNEGFHADNIEAIAPMTFFRISYTDNANNIKGSKMYLVSGYRNVGTSGNPQNNELMIFGDMIPEPYQKEDFYSTVDYESGSYYRLMKTIGEIREIGSLNNISTNLVIKEYVYANYTDVYNENHVNVYYLEGPYSNRLSDEERDYILNLYLSECSRKRQVIHIDRFDADSFLNSLLA